MFIFIFFAYNIVMVHSFIKMLKRSQDSNRHIALLTQSRQNKSTFKHSYVSATSNVGTVGTTTPDTTQTELLTQLEANLEAYLDRLILQLPPQLVAPVTTHINMFISNLKLILGLP